ncbi:hypothetical protein ALT1000_70086 [Alteromonas macleodii]
MFSFKSTIVSPPCAGTNDRETIKIKDHKSLNMYLPCGIQSPTKGQIDVSYNTERREGSLRVYVPTRLRLQRFDNH